ncbi:DUF1801 domain-containing protein [Planctomonas deserti]|uniref:DUF1801 domain-containing protein n=1 Tax=Planctomonas deserti TaxID=2144185 RepID=UPI000D339E76|nr:DUF1801 domain-containing protein [Planctomonas deserti]
MSDSAVPEDVRAYLDGLPEERRAVIDPAFETVRAAMPEGYELAMAWGMPTWSVPLATFSGTYNGKPLAYVSLAAQKNYNSLYLMALYSDSAEEQEFARRWRESGRTLDMGKSCLRFRRIEDVDLGILADTIAAVPVERFLETYERIRPATAKRR